MFLGGKKPSVKNAALMFIGKIVGTAKMDTATMIVVKIPVVV